MKYGLMLNKQEMKYIIEAINTFKDIEDRYNTNKTYVRKREEIANSILAKADSLKTITTFKKKSCVSISECFSEGLAGKCGLECKYNGFEGCDYKGRED